MKKTLTLLALSIVLFAFVSIAISKDAKCYEPQIATMMNMMNSDNYNNGNYKNDNYINSKLSQNALKVKELFESLCAQSHGDYAQGKIGPNIQGASSNDIEWALKNVSMMGYLKSNHKLQNANNVDYISDFLKSIKETTTK